MSESIYYLRQTLKRSSRHASLLPSTQQHELIAHFYVRAEDATLAGGAAGTFSVEHGLECVEYGCLPQLITRQQIAEYESEHLAAYELAEGEGFAVVLAAVLTWAR
jgi:hypothetical protein